MTFNYIKFAESEILSLGQVEMHSTFVNFLLMNMA